MLFSVLTFSAFGQQITGTEIMESHTNSVKVQDMRSDLEVKIISKNGRIQNRKLSQYIKAADSDNNLYNTIIRFHAPSDVKNTAVLILERKDEDDDQWLFLPALKKSRRISANNRKDRFMGTEITYEDIANELSEKLEEYQYNYIKTEEKNGRSCYFLEALPISDEEKKLSAYSKRRLWIDVENHIVMYSEFYDKKGKLLKYIQRSEVSKIENTNHYRAHMTYIENVQTGNKTEIISKNFKIDKGLEDAIFTKRSLERAAK